MKFENYEDMCNNGEKQQAYALQRVNDLLEQVERLKAIDPNIDFRLQIDVSLAIKDIYEALGKLLFC